MRIMIVASAIAVSVCALAACSTSEGDRLIARGAAFSSAGEDLNRGEKLVKRGRKRIAKGQKQRRKGEGLVSDGEDDVREGEALIASARKRLASQGQE